MCGGNTKETYLEILYFRQFYKHFVFAEDEEGNRNKRMEKYFEVSARILLKNQEALKRCFMRRLSC